MMEFYLKGGIHPDSHKTSDISSVRNFTIIEGDEFFIPFVQHIGSPASVIVSRKRSAFSRMWCGLIF